MAKQAIEPSSILQKCYLNADFTAAQLTPIIALINQYGLAEEEGAATKLPLYYSTNGEDHPCVMLGVMEIPDDGYVFQVTSIYVNSEEETIELTYLFNTSDAMAEQIEKNKWFFQEDETLREATGEQELLVNAVAAGEASCPIGDGIVSITLEHNEAVKDLVYIKGTDPEPTTEDERLKTYMARLKKFITLQQGKKISQGE